MANDQPLLKQLIAPPLVTYTTIAYGLMLAYHYVQKDPLPDSKIILGSLLGIVLVAYLLRNKLRELDFFNMSIAGAASYAAMVAILAFTKVTENIILIDEATTAVAFGVLTGLVFTFIGIKSYMRIHY